jgi:hypothetical protein
MPYGIGFDRRHLGRCRWRSVRSSSAAVEISRATAFSLNRAGAIHFSISCIDGCSVPTL